MASKKFVVESGDDSDATTMEDEEDKVHDVDSMADMEFDSDLEALMDEGISPKKADKTPVKRRALTDRPQFRMPRSSPLSPSPLNPGDDSRDDRGELWWSRYEPKHLSELAVHHSKVGQVRRWLETAVEISSNGNVLKGLGHFRILVLEGPAGAGKSTCIRVLAREMGLNIVEWINPLHLRTSAASYLGAEDGDVGVVRQFQDFLLRAERYTGLALDSGSTTGQGNADSRRQIILVDDLPNIAHRETRDSFRNALLRFVSTPAHQSFPLVFVVTESIAAQQTLDGEVMGRDGSESRAFGSRRLRGSNRDRNADVAVWTACDVIPGTVYNSSFCQSIRFNSVAPTILAKGLGRIVQLRAGMDGLQNGVQFSPQVTNIIKDISGQCQGDIRSATTTLQLALASLSANMDGGNVRKRRRDGKSKTSRVHIGNANVAVSNVSEGRRVTLDYIHAMGKVLYARRELPRANSRNDSGIKGRGRLESSPDEILDKMPMDPSTFRLFVQENYLDICTGGIDEVAAIAEQFSDADTMASGDGHRYRGTAGTSIADGYAAILAVRGYMYYKGHPDKRSTDTAERQNHHNNYRKGHNSTLSSFRKPQLFECLKKRATYGKMWDDPNTRELMEVVGLGDVSMSLQNTVLDAIPLWSKIVVDGGERYQELLKQFVQLNSPNCYRQLMELASLGQTSGPPLPSIDQSTTTNLSLQNTKQLVLSDDDIEDFSD